MTREWFTAAELAGLPGMPSTDRAIRLRAVKDEWQSQPRKTGKGSEYHISNLPAETRRALAEQAVADGAYNPAQGAKAMAALLPAEKPSKPKSVQQLVSLKPASRAKVDARLLILEAAAVFLPSYVAISQGELGRDLFVEAYRERTLKLPESVYQTQKPFSKITLRRWKMALDIDGPSALAGNYVRNKPALLDKAPDMAQFLTALVVEKPHLARKWDALHQLVTQYRDMKGLDWEVPSASSLRRFLLKWLAENKVAFTFATNPEGYNNNYRTAVEEMYPWMSRPNDVWEFDSSPVDAMLIDGRHSIIAVIDVYTRRVRLLVAKSSSSEGICLLLRKTLLSWGTLNENGVMRTDNGSDYVSTRVMSICSLLDINVSRSNPYSGWEKPFVERFFRTLSHSMIELLPSYIGHNVADRSVIEARKSFAKRLEEKRKDEADKEIYNLAMTREQLQTLLDSWLEAYYHNRKHSSLGMSPNEKYQQSRYSPRAVTDDSALDLLLNHLGEATVSKGFIKAGGIKYTAPELAEHTWKAQRVSVFLDPNDVGRAYLYKTGDWSERIEAVNAELLGNGVSPEAWRAAKRADAKALSGFRREMKNLAKTFGIDDLHRDVVNHFVEQAKDTLQFGQNVRELDNPALAALSGVLSATDTPSYSAAELSAIEQQREARAVRREAEAEKISPQLKTEQEVALELSRRQLSEALTEREAEWLKRYLHSHPLMARRIAKQLDAEREHHDRSSANPV